MKVVVVVLLLALVCGTACAQDAQPVAAQVSPVAPTDQKIEVKPQEVIPPMKLAPEAKAKPSLKTPSPGGPWAGDPARFFTGAFIGFLGHEAGHVVTNTAMNTDPHLMSVNYGPIPFFTIEPGRPLNRHEHYITASAGFNATNLLDEWLLTAHPRLSQEDKPLLKGIASFDFWVNVGYAATAFAGTGPDQRDTKGMADALGWPEWEVGAMILVPTGLDTYRYKHPDAKWATTLSRIAKAYMILLAVQAHD